ncbi:GNAT family N-acetyltransferase [Citrobacter sp. Cm038]|uniref:GNAT family N-acetyltransferase n=1 Tax=Citrobacter sp. Cm038 TaxID=2985117 RepID=UPI002576AAFE|nr:GNAT family protein [Citrobacter sp. Cm038]MDM2942112.1 GNAT family N-acetyltransferase [Citrobacter sp. Cm038]
MPNIMNRFNQPVGAELSGWSGAKLPGEKSLEGRYCRLERISAERHAADLYEAYCEAPDERDWTYLPSGPFESEVSYRTSLQSAETLRDPLHYAVIDKASGKPSGTVALMRIDPANGVIEVGYVTYSPRMKRTRISTEVMALLLRYVFEELRYRRLEWKCDSLNAPSRAAAERFGFRFEGIFRQAVVYRGRNRDTAWYSIIDGEYPALRIAYEKWLAADNFDDDGNQQEKLGNLIAKMRQDEPQYR